MMYRRIVEAFLSVAGIEDASSWAKLCASGICQATLSCVQLAADAAAGVSEFLLAPINVPDVVEAVGRLLHAASPPDLAARQAVGVGPRTRQPPTPTRCLLLILRKPRPVRRSQNQL